MVKSYARFLLAFAAFLLAVGAIMHASAFKKIASTVANSNLEAFAAGSLKLLWLGDSATLLFLAAVFAFHRSAAIGGDAMDRRDSLLNTSLHRRSDLHIHRQFHRRSRPDCRRNCRLRRRAAISKHQFVVTLGISNRPRLNARGLIPVTF